MITDLTDRRFGKLTAVGLGQRGLQFWITQCDCGWFAEVYRGHLISGRQRSCGCLRETLREDAEPDPIEGARWIPVGHGKFSLVDADDFVSLNEMGLWSLSIGYPCNRHNSRTARMHNVLFPAVAGMYVDHTNGNKLDNRKCNLRYASPQDSAYNLRVARRSKSGFKGVGWHSKNKSWRARVRVNGRELCVGYFSSPVEAAVAYDAAARKHHGVYATLNFPESGEQSVDVSAF